MNVLIACEESQEVCKAFRERGHLAFSCDLQECSGGHPEWHIQGDVLPIINGNCTFVTMDGKTHIQTGQWDLLIAHPPCTLLSNAGARWLYKGGELNEERYSRGIIAKQFFLNFYNAKCERIAIENPVPSSVFRLPKYSQIIQPYYFGHKATKKTCLWLKGLPDLQPTHVVVPYKGRRITLKNGKTRNTCWTMDCGKPFGGENRAKLRSKTFSGIAEAMAEQWGEKMEYDVLPGQISFDDYEEMEE